MRAVTFDRYGPPEVLRLADVEKPVPAADELLVRVRATTATRTDCGFRSAEYFVGRFVTGLVRPRRGRIGLEFAGVVEQVGASVDSYAVGERVFGVGSGTNAEYVCVSTDDVVARIPDGLSHEEAAAVPDGALSAMSLLRQAGAENGEHVLVYGASGSIGVGGVQVAKHLGARVTAVTETRNVDLVRSLGAESVLDYAVEDFTRHGERYDIVFDAVGRQTFLRCRRALAAGGRYITTDPGFLWHDALVSLFTKRAKLGIVRMRSEDLRTLADLLAAGTYRPVIDRSYPLDEVVEAHRYVDTHQKTGSVVLVV